MVEKLLSALLICCLSFSMLAGCGGRASDKDDDTPRKSASDRDKQDEKTSSDTKGKIDVDNLLDDLDIDVDIDFDLGDYGDDTSSTSLDFTVTIDPPEGWTKEAHSGNALLNYQKVDEETFDDVCLFTVYKSYAYASDDPLEIARENVASIKEYYENAEIGEVKSITIDGLPAARFDLLLPIAGFEQIQVYVYLVKDGNVIMAQGAYMSDDEQGAEDIEAILDSLRIE